jgi:hypothetical protein
MSKIKTFRGQLPMGTQEKLHLSTADGLTGYRLKKFELMLKQPGQVTATVIGKIFLNDQTGSITSDVEFNDTDLIAAHYLVDASNVIYPTSNLIMLDQEIFNQDIYVYITDADGGTNPCNYYIELEQFKIDLNTSTYQTLKNIRSAKQA